MILGIPVISDPEMLDACVQSIDRPIDTLVVIDNSPDGRMVEVALRAPECVVDVRVVDPPSNLGVAASWNLVIRSSPQAEWWAIANADTVFGAGDLDRLAHEMSKPGPRWAGMCSDWRVFGINREAVETVGFFDENFHPIYLEDCDYEYRCALAQVPWYFLDGTSTHAGSHALRAYGHRNSVTYPANLAYFRDKWGGPHRGGEVFTSPFNRGGSVRDWTLDLSRLRSQAW